MLRIVAFAAFGGLLVGYDLGLIGGALQGIKVELGLSEGQQVRCALLLAKLVTPMLSRTRAARPRLAGLAVLVSREIVTLLR